MASDYYPVINTITRHDWDELKLRAEKAQAINTSPHVEPRVEILASVLLELLRMAESQVR